MIRLARLASLQFALQLLDLGVEIDRGRVAQIQRGDDVHPHPGVDIVGGKGWEGLGRGRLHRGVGRVPDFDGRFFGDCLVDGCGARQEDRIGESERGQTVGVAEER